MTIAFMKHEPRTFANDLFHNDIVNVHWCAGPFCFINRLFRKSQQHLMPFYQLHEANKHLLLIKSSKADKVNVKAVTTRLHKCMIRQDGQYKTRNKDQWYISDYKWNWMIVLAYTFIWHCFITYAVLHGT